MVPYVEAFSNLALSQRFRLGHTAAHTHTRPHIEPMNQAAGQFPTEGVSVILSGYYWTSDGPICGSIFKLGTFPTVPSGPYSRTYTHTSPHRTDEPGRRPIPNGGCFCNFKWLLLDL